ncbi:unnamed protein product [Rhizophagus irregularis]|nr:unnamed protein product [Rhizophagus irregularis]
MDQVVSSDGNYLLSWHDVKRNNNNNYSGPILAWYKNLTDNYVLSNNLRLIHPLNDVVCDINRTHKSPPTLPDVTTPKSQWTIHWNNVQKQVIFGKTLTQETDRSTSISYLQHFIPQQTHHNNSLTPKKQLLGLVACKGCLLHSYYPYDARPTCIIAIRTQKLLLFNIFKKSSFEHTSLLEFYNRQNFVVATKPFHTLRHIAYEHFIKIDKSPLITSSQRPLDTILTPYPSLLSNNIDNHIDHALICHPDLKEELKFGAKQLELENLLTFYTDGSVQHIAAHDLHDLIMKNAKDGNSTLEETIKNISLFNTSFVDALPQSHPSYLLIHHLVPSDLTKIFNIYINDKKLRFSLFSKFFSTLMSSIDALIWTRRASLVKQWESTLSITKNKKRFYRKRHKKRTPPPPDPGAPDHNLSPS